MRSRLAWFTAAAGAAATASAAPPCTFEVRAEFPTLPPGMDRGVLTSTAVSAPDDIWVAGFAVDNYNGPNDPGGTFSLSYHWDGSTWSHVPTPNPNGSTQTTINDIAPTPAGGTIGIGGWAVLYGGPFIMDWDGSEWDHIATPGQGGPHINPLGLASVWVDPQGDAWSAGGWGADAVAVRWRGGSDFSTTLFPRVNTGQHDATGIHGSSTSNIWAVGGAGGFSSTGRALTWRYNGSSWAENHPPHLGGVEYLGAVVTLGPNDTWVAGVWEHVVDFTNTYDPLLWHWDGSNWTQFTSPDDFITGFAAFASDDIYAMGQLGRLHHWNGTAWTEVMDISAQLGYSVRLNELEIVGPCELIAAGVGAPDIFSIGSQIVIRLEAGGVSCPADFSGSSDPNDPGYGQPDGAADSADFFFFLDQFVAGNLAIADLTGSSDPNDPAYGVPDGLVDASDFFYYLDLFVQGCP